MANGTLTAFEVSIREALAFAQARRKSVGLPQADQQVRRKRDGTRMVGPDKYKVTLFLQPWHYADLIHYKQKRGISYGLNKIIEDLIDRGIDHVAARPEKAKTAAQISKQPRNDVTPINTRAARKETKRAFHAALAALDAAQKTG